MDSGHVLKVVATGLGYCVCGNMESRVRGSMGVSRFLN